MTSTDGSVAQQLRGPGHPMTADEHMRKFCSNSLPSLGGPRTEALLEAIETIWSAGSVATLAGC